jgi:hypothetical protein
MARWTTSFEKQHDRHATGADLDLRLDRLYAALAHRRPDARQAALDVTCSELDELISNTIGIRDYVAAIEPTEKDVDEMIEDLIH